MEFLDKALQQYVEQHTDAEPEVLQALNRETNLKVLKPRMLSGHLQGRVLSMFSKMLQPKYILEIGTYTGYSAICLAEGLQSGGKLITIDNNEELADMVKKYVKMAGFEHVIEPLVGDAAALIPNLHHNWDLVFIDADKTNYANYYDLIIDKVKSGGLIIADNVLWSGKVIEDVKANDKDTPALLDFNKKVQQDKRVENVLLPVRDGLMMIRKL